MRSPPVMLLCQVYKGNFKIVSEEHCRTALMSILCHGSQYLGVYPYQKSSSSCQLVMQCFCWNSKTTFHFEEQHRMAVRSPSCNGFKHLRVHLNQYCHLVPAIPEETTGERVLLNSQEEHCSYFSLQRSLDFFTKAQKATSWHCLIPVKVTWFLPLQTSL